MKSRAIDRSKYKNDIDYYVACVEHGAFCNDVEDIEILKLMDDTGNTIAHRQAMKGWKTDNEEIKKLKSKNCYSVTVEYLMEFYKSIKDWTYIVPEGVNCRCFQTKIEATWKGFEND